MICGRSQQTLLPSWPALESLVVSLGPFYTCAWCALEQSTTVGAPVSADPSVTPQLLLFLKSAGVVSDVEPDRRFAKRSLYGPAAWSYDPDWDLPGDLGAVLSTMLAAWHPVLAPEEKAWVWRQLADREVAAYLSSLLRRHRIGTERVDNILGNQEREWTELSLGRKRYVAWSSVRGAASQFLSTGGSEEAALEMLNREMHRRSRWLHQREASGALHRSEFCFLPDSTWRRPLMLDVALSSVLRVGNDYWLSRSDQYFD